VYYIRIEVVLYALIFWRGHFPLLLPIRHYALYYYPLPITTIFLTAF